MCPTLQLFHSHFLSASREPCREWKQNSFKSSLPVVPAKLGSKHESFLHVPSKPHCFKKPVQTLQPCNPISKNGYRVNEQKENNGLHRNINCRRIHFQKKKYLKCLIIEKQLYMFNLVCICILSGICILGSQFKTMFTRVSNSMERYLWYDIKFKIKIQVSLYEPMYIIMHKITITKCLLMITWMILFSFVSL